MLSSLLQKDKNDRNEFWTMVVEDHLIFIHDALKKDDTELIQRTKDLYNNVDSPTFFEDVLQLKKDILAGIITGKMEFGLPATFVNHMISELEEGMGISPSVGNRDLHEHKLWLLDAEGHLVSIMKMLDPVEKELKRQMKKSCKSFHNLFCKTLEFIGYLRSGVTDFNAITGLSWDTKENLATYFELVSLVAQRISIGEAFGIISPLMLDHMMREQSYYAQRIGGHVQGTVNPYVRKVDIPQSL